MTLTAKTLDSCYIAYVYKSSTGALFALRATPPCGRCGPVKLVQIYTSRVCTLLFFLMSVLVLCASCAKHEIYVRDIETCQQYTGREAVGYRHVQ